MILVSSTLSIFRQLLRFICPALLQRAQLPRPYTNPLNVAARTLTGEPVPGEKVAKVAKVAKNGKHQVRKSSWSSSRRAESIEHTFEGCR